MFPYSETATGEAGNSETDMFSESGLLRNGHVPPIVKRPCSPEAANGETDNSETAMFSRNGLLGNGHVLERRTIGKRPCSREAVKHLCAMEPASPLPEKGPPPRPTGQYALYLLGSSEMVLLLLGPRLDA